MIQGGDPTGTGMGGPGYKIADEFVAGSTNVRGTISMANSGPNSGGSQFFINLVDNTMLDWDKQPLSSKHPVFGKVVTGMEVVDAIGKVQTGAGDKPVEEVKIITAEAVQ
jgi:peptidylprolyl isomerase